MYPDSFFWVGVTCYAASAYKLSHVIICRLLLLPYPRRCPKRPEAFRLLVEPG